MAVLEVQGICKTFDKNTVVLRGIDFSLEKGESVAIIGSACEPRRQDDAAALPQFPDDARRG